MRALASLAALLLCAAPASAHRLDEHLQAAILDFAPERVTIELRLTPGTAVAEQVIAAIDTNRDGVLSGAERDAYGARLRGDLAVTIDGAAQPLQMVRATFPQLPELRTGMGGILLVFTTPLPRGARSLTLDNRHMADISAYLANSLVPRDPQIRITGQSRNLTQSHYTVQLAAGSGAGASHPGGDTMALLATFARHGVIHILGGYDHLLFLAALALGAATLWELVKTVTAFTIAHSFTLALAALKLVSLPAALVEPVIAASIIFVAVQNAAWPQSAQGAGRLAIAFIFGLFHGLGFAGGLLEQMHAFPAATALLAILGFSAGVELGNVAVLLPLCGIVRLAGHMPRRGLILRRAASAFVAMGGGWYLLLALGAI